MSVMIDVSGAGATVGGTAKGSPESEWFAEAQGWRWFRSLRCWGLPRSLRPETVEARVAEAVEALRVLGVAVEVVGVDDRESEAERVARRDARDRELVDVHAEAARRAKAAGDAQWDRGRDAVAGIPFGQPVLVGHHSQRRHEAAIAKSRRLSSKAVESWDEADDRAGRSASAAVRVAEREARAAGPKFGPDDVAKGDHVLSQWGWLAVCRVNRKTVTVPNTVFGQVDPLDPEAPAKWTTTLAWAKVRDVRKASS